MCEKILEYDFNSQIFTTSAEVPVEPSCNSIVIKNSGAAATTVQVKGILLIVGESFTMGGNRNEILTGRVDLVLTGAGAQATVVQKVYTGKCRTSL